MKDSMHLPNPLDFGIRAMCAALNMSEGEFVSACRNKEIAAPDRVRLREGRWSAGALAVELKKRVPPGEDQILFCLKALIRAERADGMFTESEGGDND